MYFTIRVLLITISIGSVTAAYFLNDDYAAIENMRLTVEDLGWLVLYPLFAALVTWVVITLQFRLSGIPVIWPLWNSNPFNFEQPAMFFHMTGWSFTVYGLTDLIVGWTLYGIFSRMGVIVLLVGIGIGVGIKFAVRSSDDKQD